MSDHPPVKFAAIGLDHRQSTIRSAGCSSSAPSARATTRATRRCHSMASCRRFPDLPRVRDVRALLEDAEIQLIVTAAIPSTGRIATRGDASRQGREGR